MIKLVIMKAPVVLSQEYESASHYREPDKPGLAFTHLGKLILFLVVFVLAAAVVGCLGVWLGGKLWP
jgi:hypothetical protein